MYSTLTQSFCHNFLPVDDIRFSFGRTLRETPALQVVKRRSLRISLHAFYAGIPARYLHAVHDYTVATLTRRPEGKPRLIPAYASLSGNK